MWNQFFVLEEYMGSEPQYVGKVKTRSLFFFSTLFFFNGVREAINHTVRSLGEIGLVVNGESNGIRGR